MIGYKEYESSSYDFDSDEDVEKYDFTVEVREEKFLLMFDI